MTFPFRLAATVASLLLVSGTGLAQTDNPAWLDQLEEQIAEQEQCEIGFYTFVNEEKLGGRTIQEARVQCVDGRQFDASRAEPEVRFTITECGTRVC
jgi:hypothetical protein